MASPPYTSGRGCQAGNINQDGLGYPWTPVNNTLPVFPTPDESISPSLRRAMPAQVRSTPARSKTHPLFQSPSHGMAPIPWGVNDTPMACPEPVITPQNVPWVDWSHSSQCSPTSQGGLQPAPSFNSVITLTRTGVEDRNAMGGEDLHACGHTRHTARYPPSQFRCEWAGCTYSGAFTRETCLWRHIKSTHVSPDSFRCPDPQCNKKFGRKDKFQDHMRQAHSRSPGHCLSCHA